MDKKLLTVLTSLLLFCALLLTGCQSLGIYPKGPHFERTGDMHYARSGHTATLLNNGTVLIAGGMCDPQHPPAERDYTGVSGCLLLTAEIYDPKQGKFTVIPDRMKEAHYMWGGIAPKLSDGRVVFIGEPGEHAEIYDPNTMTFSLSPGKVFISRREHALTVLKDDRVVITGGLGQDAFIPPDYTKPLDSAELFNPKTGQFVVIDNMSLARHQMNTILLPNGKVLVIGGDHDPKVQSSHEKKYKTFEAYDPSINKFQNIKAVMLWRGSDRALLLPTGKIIIIAGAKGWSNIPAELFDPITQTDKIETHLGTVHLRPVVALLPNRKILIAGGIQDGFGASAILETAELYNPNTDIYTQLPNMTEKRVDGTATTLLNGKVLITGGAIDGRASKTAEIFSMN